MNVLEIEPLRAVGVALSQNTLQELANSLGIKTKVAEMSEAQKAQLRYIQILKSTSQWQGDMGRTLVSPSNAVRVLKEQFTLLGRAVGRVFIPMIMQAIPYVMALTEILTDLANRIAAFFGYEFADIDYSNLGNISSGLSDIGDEAEDTTKKLNTMLAPFDELNVVQNKSNKNSSSGIGGDLGVDLPEYDALAGLTDQFKKNVEGAKKNLEKLWSIAKKLAIVFGTMFAINKLSKFYDKFKSLKTLFTNSKTPISTVSGLFKTLVTRFSDGYKYSKFMGETGLKSVLAGFKNLLTPASQFGLTLSGIVISFADGYKNMKDYAKGDSEFRDSLGKTIGVVGTLAGLATLLVSPWAGLGIVISGVIGSIKGYYDGVNELKILNTIFDDQGVHISALSDYFTDLFESNTTYLDALGELRSEYENSKSAADDARDSIDLFVQKLALQDGEISKTQLTELSNKYKTLRIETENTNTTRTNYYIGMIKASASARKQSDEDTAAEIANYKKIASVSAGYEQDYIDREEKLTIARYTGKISAEEYNTEMNKLNIEFGKTSDSILDASHVSELFSEKIGGIDYQNVTELKGQLDEINETKDIYIKKLEEEREKTKSTWESDKAALNEKIVLLELTGGGTEESIKQIAHYREELKTTETITENQLKSIDTAIETINGNYVGFIATVYGDLSSKGAGASSEFSEIIGGLETELKGLKDTDMSGTGAELYNSLESSILGSGDDSMIVLLRNAMKKVGISGSDELMNYISPTEMLRESVHSDYKSLGEDVINSTTGGIIGKRDTLLDKLNEVASSGEKAFCENSDYHGIGENMIEGLIGGIVEKSDTLNGKLNEVASSGQDEFCEANGIHSPSTVYKGFGEYIIEGLAEGLDESSNKVTTTLSNISKSMSDIMNGISLTFDTSGFTTCLDSILGKLQTFSDKFKSGVNSLMSSFTTTMNGVKVGSDNKLYYTKMPNVKIPRFEDGGFPKTGEFFVAREAGAEMVGRIGNRTAVANNDQITTSITNALMTALSGVSFGNNQPSTTVVNIGGRKVYEGVGDYVDSENDRYGTSYVHV